MYLVVKTHERDRKQRMEQQKILEKVLEKANLNNAYKQVMRNKGAAGVDGVEDVQERYTVVILKKEL